MLETLRNKLQLKNRDHEDYLEKLQSQLSQKWLHIRSMHELTSKGFYVSLLSEGLTFFFRFLRHYKEYFTNLFRMYINL